MFWPLYQTLLVLSAGACAVLWTRRPVRPAFGYAAAGGWIILTLQARNITAYPGGSAISVESVALQYVAAAMAILTVATLVLHYLGVYPPTVDSDAGQADIRDTAAPTESLSND